MGRKIQFLATTALTGVALALATSAFAQDAKAPEESAVTEVVLTGTRIVRDGYTAPTPVTVATTQELTRSTPSNLPDALNKLPQFGNSLSPSRSALNFANLPIHGNILNLRAVGPLRTLVLFDGVRLPPTTYIGTVDTNVVPNLLIQRVEVVTGGASAAYGSDAVSGVVNFVLDRKFKGFSGVAQAGVSERGDDRNQRIGMAAGKDFAEGRGHFLLSGEYYNNTGMRRDERKTGAQAYGFVGSVPNCVGTAAACAAGGPLNPYVAAADVRITLASNYGKIATAPAGNPYLNYVFDANGTFHPFVNGTITGSAFQLGGNGYTIPTDVSSIAPYKTYQTYGRANFDINPDLSVYVQGTFSRADVRFTSLANSFVPPTGAPIFQGNPYLPAAIAATLQPGQSLLVGEYNGPGPKPRTREVTDFWMGTAGVEGKLGDRFKWDASFTHGDSVLKTAQSGLYDWKKTYAAVDAVRDASTGQIICRVLQDPNPQIRAQYAGCSPLNVLMGDPSVTTPAGYAYATGTSRYRARIKQDSVIANVSGDVFDLPAGPVSVAVGAEYRHQHLALTTNADPALLAGATPAATAALRDTYFAGLRGVAPSALFYWLTNVGAANGSVNVKEAFGEVAVPILKDQPFFQSLELNAAGRVTDYSTSGTVETWKVGGTWKPVEDLQFRGTISRDIRAPNLFEMFAGDQSGIGFLVDPVTNTSQNISSVVGGNRNLKPEVAKTLTFGGVLSPRFLPGFNLAVDYYKLKINKAIGQLTVQQIVSNCFNLGPSAPECALITRPTPTSFPTLIRIAPANIAFLETQGIDFDASYRMQVADGNLAVRLYASRLLRFRRQQYVGAPVLDYAGISNVISNPEAFPRWRGTLNVDYSIGNFGVTVSEQYVGKMTLGIPGAIANFVDPHVGAVFYTDLSVRYDVPAMGGNVQLFGTVNNLFDKDPPLIPGTTPSVNLPTNLAIYDTVGRAYTAGVRIKF